jgi:hypothetical protein
VEKSGGKRLFETRDDGGGFVTGIPKRPWTIKEQVAILDRAGFGQTEIVGMLAQHRKQ